MLSADEPPDKKYDLLQHLGGGQEIWIVLSVSRLMDAKNYWIGLKIYNSLDASEDPVLLYTIYLLKYFQDFSNFT